MRIHKLYNCLKMAEEKIDFKRHGYVEYCNGLYNFNDLASLFIELYELHLKSQMKK